MQYIPMSSLIDEIMRRDNVPEMDSHWSNYIAIAGLVASLLVCIAMYIYCIKKRWKWLGFVRRDLDVERLLNFR